MASPSLCCGSAVAIWGNFCNLPPIPVSPYSFPSCPSVPMQVFSNENTEHTLAYAITCLVHEAIAPQYNFKTMEVLQIKVYTEIFSATREVIRIF